MSDQPHAWQPPTPGVEHQRLQPFVGSFRTEVKLYMGPGEPDVQHGLMQNEFQCDGLYLHQHYTGDAAADTTQRFLGRGYWGYNQTQQQYEGFWIDNASTMMQLETGHCDSEGKEWIMQAEFLHPHLGQRVSKRSVIRLIDQDHHTMDSYMTIPGRPEMLTMQIAYVRAR